MIDDRDVADAARELREFAKTGLHVTEVAIQSRVLTKCPVLRELPQTRRADTERPTPKFQYLVQAIVDAIDEIDMGGHPSDANVLRLLFGLAGTVRRGDWSRRQEEAARACGVGKDHFRRNLQEPLLAAIADRLLVGARPRSSDTESQHTGYLGAVSTQDELTEQLITHIIDSRPATAFLLELSTATIGTILEALRKVETQTKLLVANPYASHSAWQQERVWMTLVDRFQNVFLGYDSIEVRMYDVPSGLRGRLIGDQISLGWYTHRDDTRYPQRDPNATVIWGHDNAMVHGSVDSEPGCVLANWFKLEFERLWRHRLTHRGQDVQRMLGL